MLEYFTYKKVKKHKAQKAAEAAAKEEAAGRADSSTPNDESTLGKPGPILKHDDEKFIQDLLSNTDQEAPPLPSRDHLAPPEWHADWSSEDESDEANPVKGKGKDTAADREVGNKVGDKATEEKKGNRLSMFFARHNKKAEEGLNPDDKGVTQKEGEREKKDLGRVLDRLNLSAKNNKVFSATAESNDLMSKFTQVFKDLANGVPTAYDDLTTLIEDRDGTIAKGFDKLPSSLQKLVTQLPNKITASLGPELLATAAASQGLKTDAKGGGGFKGTAKNLLVPHNLAELISKPGAIAGMLRAIVETLKTRWPAFMGMNVIWSVALSCKCHLNCDTSPPLKSTAC